jgi:hypothetical protein
MKTEQKNQRNQRVTGQFYTGPGILEYTPETQLSYWHIGWVTQIYHDANIAAFGDEEHVFDVEAGILDLSREQKVSRKPASKYYSDKIAYFFWLILRQEMVSHNHLIELGDLPGLISYYMPRLVHPEKIMDMLCNMAEDEQQFTGTDDEVPF